MANSFCFLCDEKLESSQPFSNLYSSMEIRLCKDQDTLQQAYDLLKSGLWSDCIELINLRINQSLTDVANLYGGTYYYNYKGNAYKRLGNFDLSYISYLIAQELTKNSNDVLMQNSLLLNLGALELEKQNYQNSIQYNLKLLQRDKLSRNIRANSLMNLAIAFFELGSNEIADEYYQELMSFALEDTIIGDFKYHLMYLNYGRHLFNSKNQIEGLFFLNLASSICKMQFNENSYILPVIYHHLGNSYSLLNQPDSALQYLSKSIQLLNISNLDGKKLPFSNYESVIIELLLSRGKLLISEGYRLRLQAEKPMIDAFIDFESAIKRIMRLSNNYFYENTRFIIASKGKEVFNYGIYSAILLYQNTGLEKYINCAYEWSLLSKSLSLHWLSQRNYLYPIAGIPLDSLSKLQEMREEIQNWLDRIDVIDNEMTIPDTAGLNHLCLTVLRYELLEIKVQENYDIIRAVSDKIAISGKLVPKNFRHQTYIGYQDLDSLLIVFGVNRKQRFHKIIKLDPTIRDDIDRYKEIISRPRHGVYGQGEVLDFQDISNRIYSAIFEPVEEYIESKNLAIHLDGCLLGLPFESLVYNRTEPNQIRKFSDLDYLIQKYQFRYVASPFLLQEEGKPNSRKKSLLLTCPDQMNELSIASESNRINVILPNLDILSLDDIGSNFKTEMSNYQNIHISSHLLSRDDDFMESGLVCGNGEGSTILPFKEILYSKLNNAHIYLNGCESGSGPINHGEGLMSLSLAYAMAGAGSIIQHLWKAPDQAAADIAVQYYKNSKWIKSEKALQKAKMNYLKEAKPGHDHPFYWAGIVYYGHRHSHIMKPYLVLGAVIVLILGMVYLRRRKARLK